MLHGCQQGVSPSGSCAQSAVPSDFVAKLGLTRGHRVDVAVNGNGVLAEAGSSRGLGIGGLVLVLFSFWIYSAASVKLIVVSPQRADPTAIPAT